MIKTFEQAVIEILKARIKGSSHGLIGRWIESKDKWARLNYLNSSLWVDRLVATLGDDNPDLGKYFILVSGLITDIAMDLENKLGIYKVSAKAAKIPLEEAIQRSLSRDASMKNHISLVLETSKKVKQIIRLISDEDKSAILFFRNHYSHPVLNDYSVKIIKDDINEFEFDARKFITSEKHKYVTEVDVFDRTKNKLVSEIEMLNLISKNLNDLRFG